VWTRAALALGLVVFAVSPALADEVSEKEAADWGKKIETALNARDPKPLDESLDMDALATKGLAGLGATDDETKQVATTLKETFKPGKGLVEGMSKTGSFKFIRVRASRQGEHTTVIVRTVLTTGVNYLEYVLVPGPGGPRMVDFYSYVSGEAVSTTFRRNFMPLLTATKDEKKGKLTPEDREYLDNVSKSKELTDAVKAGEWRKAVDAFAALPESMKRWPVHLIMRNKAATNLKDPKALELADADMEKYCGKNPLMALALVDVRIRQKDMKGAVALIDSLNDSIGGDDYLVDMSGRLMLRSGDTKTARQYADKLVKSQPEARDGPSLLLDIALAEKDWPATLANLRLLEKRGVNWKDLRVVPLFADFLKTKEFATWDAEHPNAPKK
jgi:hypothetical protein